MTDLVTIHSDRLSAAINPLGAELTHLRDAEGHELMTNADPAFWTGHAPILFPVVGMPFRETIRIDGRAYPMKKHGFARGSLFEVVATADDSVTFALTDSEETRAAYPFAFRLEIAYRIEGATLHIAATVANPADVALPASFGFHPAFAWPLPYGQDRAVHRIRFDADEPAELRTIAADGTIAAARKPSPLQGRELLLRDDLFATDALVWDDVRSDAVTYGAPDGPQLHIAFPDTPMLGIWTKPGAAYVCVEPWHGIADPEGYTGEFRDKPGVFEVAPGGEKRIAMRVTLEQ
ncbi:aldose 1-epimerase family protein [Sphingomonas sp. RP10(2022)]|uniref:Aldose 1-epimerase family protein n=1 Tax=Sphingomonas liriopis TaxID=2949094 RepID=A0A9X2HQ31_9SPHN|nr:aldose 1-epimerase family protein [Sphingomonas liriopis]MCP3735083.1 aldose 1-epimerase family protein [Sphingomonas liriopis]